MNLEFSYYFNTFVHFGQIQYFFKVLKTDFTIQYFFNTVPHGNPFRISCVLIDGEKQK